MLLLTSDACAGDKQRSEAQDPFLARPSGKPQMSPWRCRPSFIGLYVQHLAQKAISLWLAKTQPSIAGWLAIRRVGEAPDVSALQQRLAALIQRQRLPCACQLIVRREGPRQLLSALRDAASWCDCSSGATQLQCLWHS